MSYILTRVPWTRQPQGAVDIDRAHPSNRQTLILRDLSIARPGVTRTGTVVRPTPGGVALGFGATKGAGASDSVAFPSMTFPSALTLIFTVSRNGAGGSGFGRLFEITSAGTWSITSAAGTLAFQTPWAGSPIWTTTASMPSTLTTVVLTYDGSSTANNPRVWWGGVERAFGAASPAPSGSILSVTSALYIGNRSDGARAWDGEIGLFGLIGAAITSSEAASISANPWQLFAPATRRIWVPVSAATGRTGDLAVTLDAATVSSASTVALAGSLFATLASATLASAGTVALTGSLSATLGAATLSATGAVALSGSTSVTLDAASVSATGSLAVSGSGALAVTLDAATVSSAATLALSASAAVTLDAATLSSASTLALTGAASITLDAATLAADGVGVQVNAGALAVTLGDATCSAAGHVDIAAALGITLADASLAAAGTLAISGAAAITLAGASLAASGTSGTAATGALAVTLDSLVIAARGRLQVLGAATLGHGRAASRRPSVTSSRRPTNASRGTR